MWPCRWPFLGYVRVGPMRTRGRQVTAALASLPGAWLRDLDLRVRLHGVSEPSGLRGPRHGLGAQGCSPTPEALLKPRLAFSLLWGSVTCPASPGPERTRDGRAELREVTEQRARVLVPLDSSGQLILGGPAQG